MGGWLDRFRRKRADISGDPAVRVLRDAAADAQRSRLPQMAAALSYRTIFGLIPVLVVGLLLVKSFTTPEAQAQVIKDILGYAGLSSIVVGEEALAVHPKAAEAVSEEAAVGPPVPDFLLGALSSKAPELDQWVNALMLRTESSVKFGAIGVVGAITLIYAALAMLVEIERAFNQIFLVPRGRSWIKRLINYWALLTLGAIGLVATFWVGHQFRTWATHVLETRGGWVGSNAISLGAVGFAVTVAISTLLLTIIYESVPNTRVKPLAAICGALIAAVLWEAGKWGFGEYLNLMGSSGYAKLYGSLALLPLFLLWVYYTWLIVLFGLQVTYQLQYGRQKKVPQPISEGGPTVMDPSSSLVVMSVLARAFQSGKTMSAAEVVKAAGLPEGAVRMVLGAACERGLAHRIERPDAPEGEAGYVIAIDPESVTAERVLQIGFDLARTTEMGVPNVAFVEKLQRAQLAVTTGLTLGAVAGLKHDGTKPSAARGEAAGRFQPV